MPPQYIKAYVKRGKNDAIDAEAICEAMSRPTMRFVPVKTAEQQAALMMLGVRDLLVKQRTMLINAIRGHAAEFGVTAAKGPVKVAELLQRWRMPEERRAGVGARDARRAGGSARGAERQTRSDRGAADGVAPARPDQPMPGDDPRHRADRRASALRSRCRTPRPSAPGRHFAAWLGLTPRENSTAANTGPAGSAGRAMKPAPAARARRHRGDPLAKPGQRLAVAARIAGAQAEEARGGRAGQQDGPHHLGHDGERRDSTGGRRRPEPPAHRVDLALARTAARWRSVEPRIGTPRGIHWCSDITEMFGTRSA